jgi:hypothetical protein
VVSPAPLVERTARPSVGRLMYAAGRVRLRVTVHSDYSCLRVDARSLDYVAPETTHGPFRTAQALRTAPACFMPRNALDSGSRDMNALRFIADLPVVSRAEAIEKRRDARVRHSGSAKYESLC